MKFVFHDGGRAAAGYKSYARDCVTRSISIVTGIPYQDVYADLNRLARCERGRAGKKARSHSRTGVYRRSYERYLKRLGWMWIPTISVGSGCKMHLRSPELPSGPLLARVSKHLTAVIDHVLYDTYDCSRGGTRCVYGYFAPAKAHSFHRLRRSHTKRSNQH